MKLSFTSKIRVIIILLFTISLVQGLLIFHRIGNFNDPVSLKMDIQNTIYITLFLQFILVIILFFYIPVFLHKAFSEIHQILTDITRGNYSIDINIGDFETRVDKEFLAVILSIKDMLKAFLAFDNLKKEKIVEHHNRIILILNLTENGFIILDLNGNIVYINDKVTDVFTSISEKTNMLETNFPPEVENNLKKYIVTILKSQTKQQYQQFFIPSLKRHIGLKSAIVRGHDGEVKGAVVAISNLEKKKPEKNKEPEPS